MEIVYTGTVFFMDEIYLVTLSHFHLRFYSRDISPAEKAAILSKSSQYNTSFLKPTRKKKSDIFSLPKYKNEDHCLCHCVSLP